VQIVMYPIINLQLYRADLHWYLRALEEVVIRAIGKLGVQGEREEGLTGVWVGGRKIAVSGADAHLCPLYQNPNG
jgi:lipoyl(octanoyl) transferase